MLTDSEIKHEICEIGKTIYGLGFIAACDGNISYRNRDKIYLSASGVSKGSLTPDQILTVDINGKVLSGKMKPTSELPMHLAVYRLRNDVNAVIHAHPPYATALSLVGLSLADCILPEVVLSLGKVPSAKYATPSSEKGADAISELIQKYDALILDRHGTLTVGKTLKEAFYKLERIEHSAKVTSIARQMGEISPLPKDEVDRLISIAEEMGVRSGKIECTDCNACRTKAGSGIKNVSENKLNEIIVKAVKEELGKLK